MPNRVSIAESIEKLTGSIFENFRPNLWLQDESAKLLSEGGNYFPFVALGLVSRLCARNIPKNERKAILAKFPASEQPARRIATWWKNHRETCWPELEEVTLKKTVAITTLIFDMRSLDIESLTETATTWVKKRDNIESIARLVGKDADRFLRPLLAETDRLAKRNRDNFSAVNYDKRLCAVSMCDPAAWWASLPAIQPEKKGKAA